MDSISRFPTFPGVISFIVPGFLPATSTDIAANWLALPTRFVLGSLFITAKIAPTSSITFTIKVSQDGGSNFGTLISLALGAGQHYATYPSPAWPIPELNKGDILRIDMTTSNLVASGVTITIAPA